MNGFVDEYGRALVPITVYHPTTGAAVTWDGWIDTGFTGALLLTEAQVVALGLPRSMAVPGALADGSQVQFETCHCRVDWFGTTRPVLAILGSGRFALIGIGLLEDVIVTIDYPGRRVTLSPATSLPTTP